MTYRPGSSAVSSQTRRITYSLRSNASWSRLLRLAGADEQLADHRAAGARDLARVLGVDGHVAPAEQPLALGRTVRSSSVLEPRAGAVVGRQEAHQHPVGAERRQLEVDDRAQQLVGHLHQDPGAVAGARVRAGGAAVLEVLERRDRARDDLVRGLVVQPRDHAHAARVVLEAGVVESDGLWRLRDVRSSWKCSRWGGASRAWTHPVRARPPVRRQAGT